MEPVAFADVKKIQSPVCKYLDVNTLLDLRMVCKDINEGIVEDKKVVERLPIKIWNSVQLRRVLESSTAFTNFILSFEYLEHQSHLNKFLDRYGKDIHRLNITGFKSGAGHVAVVQLLAKCSPKPEPNSLPLLQELEIEYLDTFVYERMDEILLKMLRNICQLRRLTIHVFQEQNQNGMKSVAFFLKLLNNCKHLEEFKIPVIDSYSQKLKIRQRQRGTVQVHFEEPQEEVPVIDANEEDWDQVPGNQVEYDPIPEWDAQDGRDILWHPIIDYIRMNQKPNGTPLKRINVQSIVLFECNTFKDLLHVCQEKGICLLGVKSTQFSYHHDPWALNPGVNNVIRSAHVSYIHPGIPISLFENVTELEVVVGFGNNYEGLSMNSDFTLPQLKNLRIQFLCDVSDNGSQLLIRKIFKDFKRPTVKKLQVEWLLDDIDYTTITPEDLVVNFGRLTQLEIHAWTAVDTDLNLLWKKLQDLEKITIKDCKNITNKAFVGDYDLDDSGNIPKRPLNRLKKLKSLTIRDITGNVNEVAFTHSFRWIKLRNFKFESSVISTVPDEVILSLINAPFGETVENFVGPTSRPSYLLGFKNLKRRGFWCD